MGDAGEESGESQGETMVVLDEVRVTMMGVGDCMRKYEEAHGAVALLITWRGGRCDTDSGKSTCKPYVA